MSASTSFLSSPLALDFHNVRAKHHFSKEIKADWLGVKRGYLLNTPSTTVPSRPAFGAQCYTPITSVTVTSYDNSSLQGDKVFTQSSGAQAFAYPIDGFALVASNTVRKQSNAMSWASFDSIALDLSNDKHSPRPSRPLLLRILQPRPHQPKSQRQY